MIQSSFKEKVILFLKGIAMGAADVVPGVSGGTIAFITGIYERLILALKHIDVQIIKLLFKGNIKEIWSRIDGAFLVTLFLGIACSIVLIANVMLYLLQTYPEFLWSFFFGLILGSAYTISKSMKFKNSGNLLMLIIGALIAYFLTSMLPASTPEGLIYTFLAGAVAICAMILPGISGGYILLILGKYEFILNALKSMDIATVLVFMLGCATGLIVFSKFLAWLFSKYKELTIALLTGFMLGSLNKIWPWKITLETYADRHGVIKPLIQENIMPFMDRSFVFAIALMVVGLILVFFVERLGNTSKTNG
ncbi:MAG: putative membrane protein [Sphingobacteriales bacterium]|jgi:putative membrane protein